MAGYKASEGVVELREALNRLNTEQRRAVEYLDGPLLVVAGPGTGKTQLLSLRAAHILASRDVAPGSILCLTYTEAGAEEMRSRLVELVGRDAYGIRVSTFHGFASGVCAAYPDHFPRPKSDRLVTDLQQAKIMDALLKGLPFGAALSSLAQGGTAYYLRPMLSFVSKVKRSGISYDDLAEIAEQNLAAADWLEDNSNLRDIASRNASVQVAEQFEEEVERAWSVAPDPLKRPVLSTPGIYVPLVSHLCDVVRRTELVDENGKTAGYRQVRDSFFAGTGRQGRCFKTRAESEKLLSAC